MCKCNPASRTPYCGKFGCEWPEEEPSINRGTEPAIIIDLDGTMCDTTHRQHHMEKKPKDWKAFYAGIADDKPHQWCLEIFQRFRHTHHILFVSGRPDTYVKETRYWLNRQGFYAHSYSLFMRQEGDYRADHVVKTEIFLNSIKPEYDVLFAVDDRQQVVDAWRALGLTCLQCAPGNF